MVRERLAELEELVLLAVIHLGPGAVAIEIRGTLAERADRPVSRGALYAALERLQLKRLLESHAGESTPRRGGLPRRRFEVTAEGLEALRAARAARAALGLGGEHVLG